MSSTTAADTPRPRSFFRARERSAWMFLLAPLILFTLFRNLPLVMAFFISLTDWDPFGHTTFVGLRHYKTLIYDPQFRRAFLNTLYYTAVTVPGSIGLGLLFAMLIEAPFIRMRPFFRTLFFLPVVSSMVAIATVWNWIYNPMFGLLNQITIRLGLGRYGWIADDDMVLECIMAMSIWKTVGYNMIIYMAGLKGISSSYYEAAAIDGANRWQAFRSITWPLLRPVTFFLIVMGMINSFQVFDQVYIITNGNLKSSTNVLVFYLYHKGFNELNLGYASAIGYYIFLFIMLFTLYQSWVNRRHEV